MLGAATFSDHFWTVIDWAGRGSIVGLLAAFGMGWFDQWRGLGRHIAAQLPDGTMGEVFEPIQPGTWVDDWTKLGAIFGGIVGIIRVFSHH